MTKRIDASPSSAGFRRALDTQAARTDRRDRMFQLFIGIPLLALISGMATYAAIAVWIGVFRLIH
jgi:hypothetical protein